MTVTEELPISIVDSLDKRKYPTPEEYNYWKSRENRTFFIDYEVDEFYNLIELSKVIIQMNMEEQANYFCDLIQSSHIPIVTVGMGVAMSSGFLIFLAGKRRYAFEHCQMLVHQGSAAFQGSAAEIEEAQKNYKKQLEGMKSYILARTDIDEKTFNKNRNKDWYLSRDELVKYKVIDKIVTSFDEIN